MTEILRKCPECGENAILQDSGPDFVEGCFAKVFECKKGHKFVEKFKFCKCEKPKVEILE